MIGSLEATAKTLGEAKRLLTTTRRAVTAYALAWRALALLMAAGALDMLWPWPAALRGLFLLALLGITAWKLAGSWRQAQPDALREEQVAREIEAQRPELDNALIHAVQFGPTLAQAADARTADLMRREIARGEQEAAHLSLEQVIARTPLLRERRALLLLAGFILLSLLLFPRAYRFEVPRFFAFWGDFPPFTLTDFDVSPTQARVRSGEGLTLSVRVGGLLPKRLELLSGGAGEAGQSTPLIATDNGLYTAQLEHLTRDTWYAVVADTGRTARYWARVDLAPRLRRLSLTYRPPAYTRRPESTTELGLEGEIRGLAGTQVALEVESDQPLAGGELRLGRADMPPMQLRLAPQPNAPTRAAVAFTLERDGDFQLSLTGADTGLQTPDAAHGKVTLLRDEKPLVAITVPGQNILAKADMTVPLHIEAEDDVALQRLELHRVINRGKETAQTYAVPGQSREFTQTERVDLKALRAKPGDVIEYYATAYDNDPQGIHNTDSDRYWIWVLSEEDYARQLAKQRGPSQMIAQYRAQVDALRQLAEEQAALAREMAANAERASRLRPGDTEAQAKVKAQTEALRQQQRALQERAQELERQMRDLAKQPAQYDIENALKRKLARMAEALQSAQRAMRQAGSAPSPGQMPPPGRAAAQQLQQALQWHGENVEKALQALEKTLPLTHDFLRLQALTQEQTRIAQQAQAAIQQGKTDAFAQSRLRSQAEQQARNQEELSQLQQDLRAHAQEAQSVAPEAARTANQVAQKIGELNISQTMQAAQQALARQDAPNGASQAEAAQRALESLLGQCKQGQQQAKSACNGQCQGLLGQGAGNSLAQMAQRMGLGLGQGSSPGSGQSAGASGSGGYSAPQPGSRPDDSAQNGAGGSAQQAAVMSLTAQAAATRSRKENKGGPRGERRNELGEDNLERPAPETPRAPTKGADRDASRYPTEYRRLVRDYFKAVAGDK